MYNFYYNGKELKCLDIEPKNQEIGIHTCKKDEEIIQLKSNGKRVLIQKSDGWIYLSELEDPTNFIPIEKYDCDIILSCGKYISLIGHPNGKLEYFVNNKYNLNQLPNQENILRIFSYEERSLILTKNKLLICNSYAKIKLKLLMEHKDEIEMIQNTELSDYILRKDGILFRYNHPNSKTKKYMEFLYSDEKYNWENLIKVADLKNFNKYY